MIPFPRNPQREDLARIIALMDIEDEILKRLSIPEALEACRFASHDVAAKRISMHIVDYGEHVQFRVGDLVAEVSREDMRELTRLYLEEDTRRKGK